MKMMANPSPLSHQIEVRRTGKRPKRRSLATLRMFAILFANIRQKVIVYKYLSGKSEDKNEIYVPDYQRELIWSEKNQSRFIESLLIGLPIPFIFVADVGGKDDPEDEGRLEIVDGVQRIRTLARFITNDLIINDLERVV